MQLKSLKASLLAIAFCTPLFAHAELGIYAKAGTFGVGGGIGYGISDSLAVRVGYTAYNFDKDVNTTDVDFKGKLKLGGAEAMLDWFPFSGAFRITGGLVSNRNKIDLEGKRVTINGTSYDVNTVGSLDGSVEFKTTVPYLGIGWGNIASSNGSFHFVADIGVIFQGSPDVKLQGGCNSTFASSNAVECAQFQSDIPTYENDANDEVSNFKHWPVISFGLGYRF